MESLRISILQGGTTGIGLAREGVQAGLERWGHVVSTMIDGTAQFDPGRVVWIQGTANWFPNTCGALASLPENERPFTVIWHSEPLPPSKASGLPRQPLHFRELVKIAIRHRTATDYLTNWRRIRRLAARGLPDLLVVSTEGRREFLAENGVEAHCEPLGYEPGIHGRTMGLERDIDALFLGILNLPRRKKIIRNLRRRGIDLHAVGRWGGRATWGENRIRLLNRAKICLNISRYPGMMAGQRLLLGMANGTLVISEPMYKSAPYVPGKHFISATVDEMPEVIRHYLADDAERERIAAEGHRLVTRELTMKKAVGRIAALIREKMERMNRE